MDDDLNALLAVLDLTFQPQKDATEEQRAIEERLKRTLDQQIRDRNAKEAERQERKAIYTNMQNDIRRAMAGDCNTKFTTLHLCFCDPLSAEFRRPQAFTVS
jgi:hypothetical protein